MEGLTQVCEIPTLGVDRASDPVEVGKNVVEV